MRAAWPIRVSKNAILLATIRKHRLDMPSVRRFERPDPSSMYVQAQYSAAFIMRTIIVDIAKREAGVREDAGRNNVGARIRDYQAATWLAPGAWPWCAAFAAWVLREAVMLPAFREALHLTSVQATEWRCHDASAFGWVKWAKAKHLTILEETDLARAGDFVVFDFSHIGIVTEDQQSPTNLIRTIEGNTNGKGDRDSVTGDGVWTKSRAPGLVKNYIRLFP